MIFTLSEALTSLYPGAHWTCRNHDYELLDWTDTSISKPSKAIIDAEIIRLQSEYDAQEYARNRIKEYPPLTDLADALYHQSKGDETKLTAYLAKCEAVKQKYPKE